MHGIYNVWMCLYMICEYAACKAYAPGYIVTCALAGCTIFSHIVS
jgi:hypothetical protein